MRAGYLLGETRWLEAGERTLRAAWLALNRFPHGHMSLLEALAEYLDPPEIVIIRGTATEAKRLASVAVPRRITISGGRDIPPARRAGSCGHAGIS